jgi:cob(I)alamin adenosyltransferase
MLKKGYVQLYTGNGKGKTTAALGLALRAAGAGLKIIIIQFMKGQHYCELYSIREMSTVERMSGKIEIEQYGSTEFCKIDDKNFNEHIHLAQNALVRAKEVIVNKEFDIVILDEIVTGFLFKLFSLEEIIDLIDLKPETMELILTGRGAPNELIQICDLVTEMKEVKHYFSKGVLARRGIEN